MPAWDDQYCTLAREILDHGQRVHNRTGTDSIKIPSWHFRINLKDGFPALTTKQLFIRQAVLEILWIWQARSNDVRWLQDRNVHIWDKWEINEEGKWIDEDTGKVLKSFDPSFAHTIGTAYGYVMDKYRLPQRLIDSLRNDPEDRRRVVSLWQESELDTAVLPPCVWSTEWDVTDGKLNLWVHQRSCDVPLGLPFNVAQYATLLMMIAQVTGLEPGTMDWSIKDAHIYVDQVEGMKEQLRRWQEEEPKPAPTLWIDPAITEFEDFDSSAACASVKLENYEHMGKLRFALTQ